MKLRRANEEKKLISQNEENSSGINYISSTHSPSRQQSGGNKPSSNKKESRKSSDKKLEKAESIQLSRKSTVQFKELREQKNPKLLKKGLTMAARRQSLKQLNGAL